MEGMMLSSVGKSPLQDWFKRDLVRVALPNSSSGGQEWEGLVLEQVRSFQAFHLLIGSKVRSTSLQERNTAQYGSNKGRTGGTTWLFIYGWDGRQEGREYDRLRVYLEYIPELATYAFPSLRMQSDLSASKVGKMWCGTLRREGSGRHGG